MQGVFVLAMRVGSLLRYSMIPVQAKPSHVAFPSLNYIAILVSLAGLVKTYLVVAEVLPTELWKGCSGSQEGWNSSCV